ncbi:MAG: hypothetical protein PHI97_22690, partial [Desulfobulbus sp.]|nr:hypothetical protein [Desulfobulbus sp.]
MPEFTAVAANLVQTTTSSGLTQAPALNKTSKSFSSHLETATGKKTKAQNTSAAGGQVNESFEQNTIAETNAQKKSGNIGKIDKNQKETDNNAIAETAETLQAAQNQPASSEHVDVAKESSPQVFEDSVKSSPKNKESVVGQMLSKISDSQDAQSKVNEGLKNTPVEAARGETFSTTQDQPFAYQHDFKSDTTAPTTDNSKSTTLQKTQDQPFTYQQDFKSDTSAPTTDNSKSTTLQKTQDQPFAYQHDFKSDTTVTTADNSKSTTLQKTQDQPD